MQTLSKNCIADFETQLASKVIQGATTATIVSNLDEDGIAIPGGRYFLTIDKDNSRKEYWSCTVSGVNITDIKSISRQGAETTGVSKDYHRAGANVIISDFASISKINDLLTATTSFDSATVLKYDGVPTMSNPNGIPSWQNVLNVVTGGTVNFSNQTFTGTAGEALAVRDVVYFKESDQRWYKAEADTLATFNQVRLGINTAVATLGGSCLILVSGIQNGYTGLTAGSKYYLSDAAGQVSTTAGTTNIFIGVAENTSSLRFEPQTIYAPSKNEKDAMAGTNGVPSSANKFATSQDLNGIIKNGGTGADGVLNITSGASNIDLGGANLVIKNYTSISITGTGQLTFSNPGTNGTFIILKSQAGIIATSSAIPNIEASGMGGSATNFGISNLGFITNQGSNGQTGNPNVGGIGGNKMLTISPVLYKNTAFACGAGGGNSSFSDGAWVGGAGGGGASKINNGVFGNGGAASGNSGTGLATGGRGGGVLVLECIGAWNVTGAIYAKGLNGQNATGTPASGAGGGGGGEIFGRYGSLISNSGAHSVAGGAGGAGAGIGFSGGAGGTGLIDIGQMVTN